MKKKVIAIVISVVIIAGVGTAVGVTVNKSNDKETESLVNEAVSNALASALPSEESTTEESATEKNTQSLSENNKSTTAQPQVVQDENKNTVSYSPEMETKANQGGQVVYFEKEPIKRPEHPKHYNYEDKFYKVARFKGDLCNVNQRTGDGPDDGKYFLTHGADGWSLDEIKGQYEFVYDKKINDIKQFDSNGEPYYEVLGNEKHFDNPNKMLFLDEYGKEFHFINDKRVYTGE